MQHSSRFENIQNFYDSGFWDIEQVRNAVDKGWITCQEYTQITGHDF
jgi:uncharacterized XkdX family phage protein